MVTKVGSAVLGAHKHYSPNMFVMGWISYLLAGTVLTVHHNIYSVVALFGVLLSTGECRWIFL